jgi:hypothetical protein
MLDFYYELPNCIYTQEYHNYIIKLIHKIIKNNTDISLNLILGELDYNLKNDNKIVRINYNFEHTLVKKGGRSTENSIEGNITCIDNENEKYLIRIDNFNCLKNYDIIIDYSIPNIINVKTNNELDFFSKKMIYIAPFLYDFDKSHFIVKNRTNNSLTTFINTNEPRRSLFLQNIKSSNLNHLNVNNIFDKDSLQKLYLETKILINIHQTEHHHTFEELRVLPAILSGVIVISEDSPLKEHIPYNEFIVWTSFDNIINKYKEITENYDYYYNHIFKNIDKIKSLEEINYNTLKNKLLKIMD